MSNPNPDYIPYEQNDGPTAGPLIGIALATLAIFFTFIYNVSP